MPMTCGDIFIWGTACVAFHARVRENPCFVSAQIAESRNQPARIGRGKDPDAVVFRSVVYEHCRLICFEGFKNGPMRCTPTSAPRINAHVRAQTHRECDVTGELQLSSVGHAPAKEAFSPGSF